MPILHVAKQKSDKFDGYHVFDNIEDNVTDLFTLLMTEVKSSQ